MTIAERNNKLKYFITCLKCEVSGKCCDDNCSTQYDAGNMGEIIENLETISKALEQESILDKIKAEIKEWYWQADKQALAEDPCVVDAMVDLFIRTIDKYKTESEKYESSRGNNRNVKNSQGTVTRL